MATREELLAALDAPIETETFEVAPGVELEVRGVMGYARMTQLHREAEAISKASILKPVTCGGEVVIVNADMCNAAVMVVSGVAEPQLSIVDALKLSHRYPVRFVELLSRISVLSGQNVDAATNAAEQGLGLDPTEPPVSE